MYLFVFCDNLDIFVKKCKFKTRNKKQNMEPEKRTTKRDYFYELIAAIMIGLATTLGAWSAYQSSLYSGMSIENYTLGSNTLGQANTSNQQATQQYIFDMLTWMEYTKQTSYDDSTLLYKIKKEIMTPEISKTVDWLEYVNTNGLAMYNQLISSGDTTPEDYARLLEEIVVLQSNADSLYFNPADSLAYEEELEFFTPIYCQKYTEALTKEVDSLYVKGEEYTALGRQHNETGDTYMLLTVLFTIVLFFAGITMALKQPSIKFVFILISIGMLVISTIWMVQLPMA
ncbi:MAG: hypothetical protein A2W91_06175 [Bacteroidetes bacterium GWF2_38_335]|nr:MAG: hypothetical protein A2W91_06175 [Bacteroidetes bacterium GWF2_38_335]OFY79664.1 MAG: hypothetical protein A2281_09505 [Bacteroidetes bacterium RIFOXYA12_FULL_38_20]HBS89013.1 hypothetical protein [Bacteroidales bacterium]